MNKLILDSSTEYLYVSVVKNDETTFTKALYGKNNHSEHMIGIIEEGLSGLDASCLDQIIVGIGPVSYTGVRVALTIAKVLAWTLNKPLKTISSLTLIGSGYLRQEGVYAISSVAKKGYVYGKIIKVNMGNVEILFDDNFLTEEEFAAISNDYKALKVNAECYKYDNLIIDNLAKITENVHEVVPNYLRKAN